MVGRRDHDGVDILAVEDLAEILDARNSVRKLGHLGDPLAEAGKPRVKPIVGALKVRLIDVAERDDLGVRMRQECAEELAATIADTDERELDSLIGTPDAGRHRLAAAAAVATAWENTRRLT